MSQLTFRSFADTVVSAYQRSPDRFWEVTMAPFLSRNPTLTILKNSRLAMTMLHLFRETHKEAWRQLDDRGKAVGLDLVHWPSLKSKEEYFTDAYPIYAFLAIWMHEHGLTTILDRFDELLTAVVDGIAGYGILDVVVDSPTFSPVELLEAQHLITEYELRIVSLFGVTATNQSILHRVRSEYLKSEIKEKSLRFIASPYPPNKPIHCGTKAAHLLTPFMLSLETLNRGDLIDDYYTIFMQFGAVIQILDDIKDLEEDLSIGHYAYITHNTSVITQLKNGISVNDVATQLRHDMQHLRQIYAECVRLIDDAEAGLVRLNDSLLIKIVQVTRLRMDTLFLSDLKIHEP